MERNEGERGLQCGQGCEAVVVTFRATAVCDCTQVTAERAEGILPVIGVGVSSADLGRATVVAWVGRCSNELPSAW